MSIPVHETNKCSKWLLQTRFKATSPITVHPGKLAACIHDSCWADMCTPQPLGFPLQPHWGLLSLKHLRKTGPSGLFQNPWPLTAAVRLPHLIATCASDSCWLLHICWLITQKTLAICGGYMSLIQQARSRAICIWKLCDVVVTETVEAHGE